MPYRSQLPTLRPDPEQLRAQIPGWGVDLPRERRPGVPKERFVAGQNGARWAFPTRQPELVPREKSPEHAMMTPVFGTTCPTKGLSGVIRRAAYRLSEGRTAHWLLLMLGDRIDVMESLVVDALRGRPDNFIAEHGYKAEVTRHGIRSRFGRGRADTRRLPFDLLFLGGVVFTAIRAVHRIRARRRPLARLMARVTR